MLDNDEKIEAESVTRDCVPQPPRIQCGQDAVSYFNAVDYEVGKTPFINFSSQIMIMVYMPIYDTVE